MKRFKRKLRKAFNPVELGQTRGGFILAAVLIAAWQLSAPVKADAPSSGYSENDYFRLEWYYHQGHSGHRDVQFYLEPVGLWTWRQGVLEHARFTTVGVTFDYIEDTEGNPVFSDPVVIGEENGMPVYEYDLLDALAMPDCNTTSSVSMLLWGRFPDQDVVLRDTELRYEGYSLSAAGGLIERILPGSMPFVSIQAIPEPAGVATLGLGAVALAALLRRRDAE